MRTLESLLRVLDMRANIIVFLLSKGDTSTLFKGNVFELIYLKKSQTYKIDYEVIDWKIDDIQDEIMVVVMKKIGGK